MSRVWVLLKSTENCNLPETRVAGVFSVYEEAYNTAIKEILHWCEEEAGIEVKDIYSTLKVEECELVKVISYGNQIPLNLEEVRLSSVLHNLSELACTLYQRKLASNTSSKGKGVETKQEMNPSGKLVRFVVTSHLVDVYEADDEDFQLHSVSENSDLSEEDEAEFQDEDIGSDLEMDVDEDELNGLLEDLEHGPEQLLEMARTRSGTEPVSAPQSRPGTSKS